MNRKYEFLARTYPVFVCSLSHEYRTCDFLLEFTHCSVTSALQIIPLIEYGEKHLYRLNRVLAHCDKPSSSRLRLFMQRGRVSLTMMCFSPCYSQSLAFLHQLNSRVQLRLPLVSMKVNKTLELAYTHCWLAKWRFSLYTFIDLMMRWSELSALQILQTLVPIVRSCGRHLLTIRSLSGAVSKNVVLILRDICIKMQCSRNFWSTTNRLKPINKSENTVRLENYCQQGPRQ